MTSQSNNADWQLTPAAEDPFEELISRSQIKNDTDDSLNSLYQTDIYPNVYHQYEDSSLEVIKSKIAVGDLIMRRTDPLAASPGADVFYKIVDIHPSIRGGGESFVGRPFALITSSFLGEHGVKLGIWKDGVYSCKELVEQGENCEFSKLDIITKRKFELRYFKPSERREALTWVHSKKNRFFYSFRYIENEATSDLAFSDADGVPLVPSDNKKLRVLDIFAGCGGFSFGLSQAGLDVVFGVEFDEDACKTLQKNHSTDFDVLQGDAIGNLKVIRDMLRKVAQADPTNRGHLAPKHSDWIIEEPPRHSVGSINGVYWRSEAGNKDVLMASCYMIGSDDEVVRPLSQVSHGTAFKTWKQENPDEWYEIKQTLLNKRTRNTSMSANEDDSTQLSNRVVSGNVSTTASLLTVSHQEDGENDDDIILIEEVEAESSVLDSSLSAQENIRLRKIQDWRVGNKNDEIEFQLEKDQFGAVPWVPGSSIEEESIIKYYREQIDTLPHRDTVDIIVGGPPCQDFSRANTQSRMKDETFFGRNALVLNFLDWVSFIQPRFVVMENVLGMLDFSVPKQVTAQLLAWGYQVRIQIVTATGYGVPQNRSRVFIIAAKSGEKLPKLPASTHYMKHARAFKHNTNVFAAAVIPVPDKLSEHLWKGLEPCPTVKDAICDLPQNFTKSGVCEYRSRSQTVYQAMMRYNTTITKMAMTRQHYDPKYTSGEILDPDSYAGTITTKRPLMHYHYNRCLSVREVARLFGYPDCFDFPSGQSSTAMFRQLGNSVAPPVAFVIGRAIVGAHLETKKLPDTPEDERLRSYIKFETRPWQQKMFIDRKTAKELFNHHRISIRVLKEPSQSSSSDEDESSSVEYGVGPAGRIKRAKLQRSARPLLSTLEEQIQDEESATQQRKHTVLGSSGKFGTTPSTQYNMLRYSGDGISPTDVYDSGSDSESVKPKPKPDRQRSPAPFDEPSNYVVWIDIPAFSPEDMLVENKRRRKKRKYASIDKSSSL